jgi:hypothetical protein
MHPNGYYNFIMNQCAMKLIQLYLLIPAFLFFSCSNNPPQNILNEDSYSQYLERGGTISAQAQSALLSHVSEAMKQGGSSYAVEFCNLKASGITDSLDNKYNCSISRVSVKNRNPDNDLTTDTEKQLWDYFLSVHENRMIHDTVVQSGSMVVYYKPILTAMQACLQCHGQKEQIDKDTYSKIMELYPEDKAIGYEMNELRGLWKIEFEPEKISR